MEVYEIKIGNVVITSPSFADLANIKVMQNIEVFTQKTLDNTRQIFYTALTDTLQDIITQPISTIVTSVSTLLRQYNFSSEVVVVPPSLVNGSGHSAYFEVILQQTEAALPIKLLLDPDCIAQASKSSYYRGISVVNNSVGISSRLIEADAVINPPFIGYLMLTPFVFIKLIQSQNEGYNYSRLSLASLEYEVLFSTMYLDSSTVSLPRTQVRTNLLVEDNLYEVLSAYETIVRDANLTKLDSVGSINAFTAEVIRLKNYAANLQLVNDVAEEFVIWPSLPVGSDLTINFLVVIDEQKRVVGLNPYSFLAAVDVLQRAMIYSGFTSNALAAKRYDGTFTISDAVANFAFETNAAIDALIQNSSNDIARFEREKAKYRAVTSVTSAEIEQMEKAMSDIFSLKASNVEAVSKLETAAAERAALARALEYIDELTFASPIYKTEAVFNGSTYTLSGVVAEELLSGQPCVVLSDAAIELLAINSNLYSEHIFSIIIESEAECGKTNKEQQMFGPYKVITISNLNNAIATFISNNQSISPATYQSYKRAIAANQNKIAAAYAVIAKVALKQSTYLRAIQITTLLNMEIHKRRVIITYLRNYQVDASKSFTAEPLDESLCDSIRKRMLSLSSSNQQKLIQAGGWVLQNAEIRKHTVKHEGDVPTNSITAINISKAGSGAGSVNYTITWPRQHTFAAGTFTSNISHFFENTYECAAIGGLTAVQQSAQTLSAQDPSACSQYGSCEFTANIQMDMRIDRSLLLSLFNGRYDSQAAFEAAFNALDVQTHVSVSFNPNANSLQRSKDIMYRGDITLHYDISELRADMEQTCNPMSICSGDYSQFPCINNESHEWSGVITSTESRVVAQTGQLVFSHPAMNSGLTGSYETVYAAMNNLGLGSSLSSVRSQCLTVLQQERANCWRLYQNYRNANWDEIIYDGLTLNFNNLVSGVSEQRELNAGATEILSLDDITQVMVNTHTQNNLSLTISFKTNAADALEAPALDVETLAAENINTTAGMYTLASALASGKFAAADVEKILQFQLGTELTFADIVATCATVGDQVNIRTRLLDNYAKAPSKNLPLDYPSNLVSALVPIISKTDEEIRRDVCNMLDQFYSKHIYNGLNYKGKTSVGVNKTNFIKGNYIDENVLHAAAIELHTPVEIDVALRNIEELEMPPLELILSNGYVVKPYVTGIVTRSIASNQTVVVQAYLVNIDFIIMRMANTMLINNLNYMVSDDIFLIKHKSLNTFTCFIMRM